MSVLWLETTSHTYLYVDRDRYHYSVIYGKIVGIWEFSVPYLQF